MKNEVQLIAFKADDSQILDASLRPIDQLKLVEMCGRTCYKSQDKITPDSAERFVKALIKSGHEAMLEFSWLTFTFSERVIPNFRRWLIEILKSEAFIKVTEKDGCFLISGNFRSFRDLLRRIGLNTTYPEQLAIYLYLKNNYPAIIEDWMIKVESDIFKGDNDNGWWYKYYRECGFYNPFNRLTDEEKIKHYFAVARFIGSRAFTHQLVRHRRSDFAQESQRYCDERGFFDDEYFIVPPSIEEAGLKDLYLGQLKEIDSMYQKLLEELETTGLRGKKLKEDARFLLPNAVKSEICVAGNLEQWFRVFKLRLDSHAQWEIRGVMEEFQRQLYAALPEAERLYEVFLAREKSLHY